MMQIVNVTVESFYTRYILVNISFGIGKSTKQIVIATMMQIVNVTVESFYTRYILINISFDIGKA